MNDPDLFKQSMVVVDLDNTLVDTAVRKQAILAKVLGKDKKTIEMSKVRTDFELRSFLGDPSEDTYRTFFSILESPEGIENHPAPGFSGAKETVEWLRRRGCKVVIVTCRREPCREVTLKELADCGIPVGGDELKMLSSRLLKNGVG